jgi:hypothetical protein
MKGWANGRMSYVRVQYHCVNQIEDKSDAEFFFFFYAADRFAPNIALHVALNIPVISCFTLRSVSIMFRRQRMAGLAHQDKFGGFGQISSR